MNLTAIRNAVTSKVGRQILTVRKHSPALLLGAGVIGIVATVVIASRATLKLDDILEEADERIERIKTLKHNGYSEDDRHTDIVKVRVNTAAKIIKLYAPAVGIGAVSIAAITGSHIILDKRYASAVAAYAALDKGFKEYRARVVGELGEDKEREFRYGYEEREIVEEGKNGPVVKTIRRSKAGEPSIYAKWFDEGSPNFDKRAGYNMMFLNAMQAQMNNRLMSEGFVFLNDVYEALGLKRTREGALVGWVLDGGNSDNYIDFGCFDGSKREFRDFVNGWNSAIMLDFNVDGIIYNKI